MSSKGQLTVPKAVRDALGIEAGDRIEFVPDGAGGFKIRTIRTDLSQIRGLLAGRVERSVSTDAMADAVQAEAAERAKRAGDR